MRLTKIKSCIDRVCGCCNQTFYIGKDNLDEAIYYDKKTYHSSCFINKQVQSFAPKPFRQLKMLPKNNVLKDEYGIDVAKYKNGRSFIPNGKKQLLDDFNNVRKEKYNAELLDFQGHVDDITQSIITSQDFLQIKKFSDAHLLLAIEKQCVYEFILDTYDINIIPTNIWEKIDNIYNGTFKGMSIGIPPAHLLDMWKRKIPTLNDIANKNLTKGIHMTSAQRLNYDLSILVNKYDSYLKWLEKQKILEAEKEIEKNENIVVKSIGYNAQKIDKSNSGDISDLVDDIFG